MTFASRSLYCEHGGWQVGYLNRWISWTNLVWFQQQGPASSIKSSFKVKANGASDGIVTAYVHTITLQFVLIKNM